MKPLWTMLCLTLLLTVAAHAQSIRQLRLPANDLAADPVTGRIYASVPSRAGSIGNSVIPIDPETGEIGQPIFVGSEPGKLAMADNGRYLYVALQGAASVRRVDLLSQTADIQFSLGMSYGPNYAEDLEVLPGHPESVAVSKYNQGISPRLVHVAIYDNGVQRPHVAGGPNVIAFSDRATRLYGLRNELSDFEFVRWDVDETGIVGGDTIYYWIPGFGTDIRYAGGRIYATNGGVYDPEARVRLGTLPGGMLLPDAGLRRVFHIATDRSGGLIRAFDWETYLPTWEMAVPGVEGGAASLVRWGLDGLAFRTGTDQIFLLRTGLSGMMLRTLALTIHPSTVTGGAPATGTITVDPPAPQGGWSVTLSSDKSAVASVPTSVTIPPGATSVTFSVTTYAMTAPTAVTISAASSDSTRSATLHVTPPTPGTPGNNLLVNGSFEEPRIVRGRDITFVGGRDHLPGWQITRGSIDVAPDWQPAPDGGTQSLDLVGVSAGSIEQTFATLPGAEYLFEGWIAHNPDAIDQGRGQVYLNGQPFVLLFHQDPNARRTDMRWVRFAYRFRATASTTRLAIVDTTNIYDGGGLFLDGLSVTPATTSDGGGGTTFLINGVTYAPGYPQETLTATFTRPDGGVTVNTYQDYVLLRVSGIGQSYATAYNDAFYLFTGPFVAPQNGHDGGYYQLTFGTSPLGPFSLGSNARNFLVGSLPAYNPAHDYQFVLDTRLWDPGHLHFGVSDGGYGDNSGAYTITVTQLSPLSSPSGNLLVNGSFETPGSGPSWIEIRDGLPGWRITRGSVDVVGVGYWPAAPGHGTQSLDLAGGAPGTIEQTFATVPDQEYLFSGWMAHNPVNPRGPDGRADVSINGQPLVQLYHRDPQTSLHDMRWVPFAYRFRATDSATTLVIADRTTPDLGVGLTLDGLAVTPATGGDDGPSIPPGGLPPGHTASPPVYNPANGHWYQSIRVSGITWQQADAIARGLTHAGHAGYLVTLTSPAEQEFVVGNLASVLPPYWWIGAYQDRAAADYREPAGGWRWVTGEPWQYTNWGAIEPNNFPPGEHWAHVDVNLGNRWNDFFETSLLPGYVVEYGPGDLPQPPAPKPTDLTLALDVESATGGSAVTGRVTLNAPAPAGGLVVLLGSSNPLLAVVPASVTVPAGQTEAAFTVQTVRVALPAPVVIGASGCDALRLATLILLPGEPDPPATTATITPAPNAAGWHNADVSIDLAARSGPGGTGVQEIRYILSGAQNDTGAAPGSHTVLNVSAEGTTSVTYYAVNHLGHAELPHTIEIRLDKTAPTLTAARSPEPNAHGWNNADVTVSFVAQDALSGVAAQPQPILFTQEGANQTATVVAVDQAGNQATFVVQNVKIDKTPPTVVYSPNRTEYSVSESVNIACTPTDALSGVVEHNCSPIQGNAGLFKRHEPNVYSAFAKDRAGNVGQASIAFTIRPTGSDDPLDEIIAPGDPPITVATPVPAPNQWGWNNTDVSVNLAATAPGIGRSVREIRYRLEGAQQGEGAMNGRTARLPITAEGETRVIFYAVNTFSQVEEPQTVVIRIDKTAPTVTYEPARERYRADETIDVTCRAEDALSGIAEFDGRDLHGSAAFFKLRGLESFTATATDRAGNVGQATLRLTVENTFDALAALTTQMVETPKIARAMAKHPASAKSAALRGAKKKKAKQIAEFIKKVKKQRGRTLTPEEADMLIALARGL